MKDVIYLSVVLSTYNEENYIEKSVRSILNQTYPYFEIIVVNDGSTDNTLSILQSIQDGRIVIVDKQNTGLPDSLNIGISRAKHNWIARMDGDDIAEPTRFENQIKAIDDRVGVIGGQYQPINNQDSYISNGLSHKPISSFRCKFDLLLGRSPFAHPSVLIRKDLLLKYGGYDTNFKVAQDIELWMRLAPSTKMCNLRIKVLNYRFHNNNITSKQKDLQRKLTFMGFMKFALQIRRPLSETEFKKFEVLLENKNLIDDNTKLYDKTHELLGPKRNISIYFYYAWRLHLLLRYRMASSSYKKLILS